MPDGSDLQHARLLIVDNQEDNIVLLEQMLRNAGYESVTSTQDPKRVAALHREHRYDLILLDLQMPGLDGFQVMAALREIEPEGELPVLVITAQPEQRRRALAAGARDFIGKPFQLDEVLIRVRGLLALSRLRDRAGDPGARPANADSRVSVPRTLGWILGALAALWLIYRLWTVAVLVVLALVLAGALHPLVVAAEKRGLSRRHALMVVITGLSLGGALLAFLTVPPLIEQFGAIFRNLPGQRLRLITELDQHAPTRPLAQALSDLRLTESLGRVRPFLLGHTSDAAVVLGYALTTIFLSFYFLADGKRTQGALYAVVPRTHHMRLARIIHNLRTIVGGYVRGQLITSLAFGTLAFLLLSVCGVSNALPFALLAALLDVIPTVGGLLAAGPAFFAALGQGPKTALAVLIVMLAYQAFENKVLVPRVYGHALRLSPVTVTLALIAGGILFGVMGALFALPIAAALQMIPRELGLEMPGDDTDDSLERKRDQKLEAAYEVMSAGATAPDAGQIANDLAHGLREADAWVLASDARKKPARTNRVE